MTLGLARLTRWGRDEIMAMDYEEALWWLDGAAALEEKIYKG